MKNNKGITLIALVITVIILLILAAVSVSMITGNDGLFSKANEAGTFYNEKAQKEADEIEKLLSNIEVMDITDNNSIIGKVANITKSGIQTIEVNGKTYNINVIILNGDVVLDGIKEYTGSVITNGNDDLDYIYEFGDKTTDVATATVDAQNMVVLKVNGNLTINSKIGLTACKSDDGYGGPKGLLICCSKTITNNGEISMTARGARAVGEDVYLWQNSDGTYETVPAAGGVGGEGNSYSQSATKTSVEMVVEAKKGHDGIETGNSRATGGGGTGAGEYNKWSAFTATIGAGGAGTSYSGGTGSGGIDINSGGTFVSTSGSINGGAGGDGASGRAAVSGHMERTGGGGAGNPAGNGKFTVGTIGTNDAKYNGENGTGGLLIVYANELKNNGSIISNGSRGGTGLAGGGSSGGGSINIFANKVSRIGTLKADGGEPFGGEIDFATITGPKGGAGGQGSVSIGTFYNGDYKDINIE